MDVINTTVLVAFQLAVVAALLWFVGSLALRFIGWMWIAFGLAIAVGGASTGAATPGTYGLALFNITLGAAFWAAGHGIHRARRGYWKSSVMRRVAALVPRREQ